MHARLFIMLSIGCAASAAPQSLRPIDSVRVLESDSSLIARVGAVALGGGGRTYLSDSRESHVLEIARDGRILRTFGRHGEGPGEFDVASSIDVSGDTLLTVMAFGQHRASFFDLRSGHFIRSFYLTLNVGFAQDVHVVHGKLYVMVLEPDSGGGTVMVSFSPAGARIGAQGVVPPLLQSHPLLRFGFSDSAFAIVDGDVYATFELSQKLYHWKLGARSAEALAVPAQHRKGVRTSLFEELLRDPSLAPKIGDDRSIPMGLYAMGEARVVLLTIDGTFNHGTFVGRYYASVIDVPGKRACVDIPVDAPDDPTPRLAAAGDTLVVVQQAADRSGQWTTAIRRFRIDTSGCRWVSTVR